MNLATKLWLGSRACVYWIGFMLSTVLLGSLYPILKPIPYKRRYHIVTAYNTWITWWTKIICGIRLEVKGRENIKPDQPMIIMANHQSTYETLCFATIFPPMAWILKKELLKIPFFGWGLALLDPIGLDRDAGMKSLKALRTEGKERLERGSWLVIFPEGTRVDPDEEIAYKPGGASLAAFAGYPVLPVAHNAGECWPRHAFLKKPGTVTISIGEPIDISGMKPAKINEAVKAWIDTEKQSLPKATHY